MWNWSIWSDFIVSGSEPLENKIIYKGTIICEQPAHEKLCWAIHFQMHFSKTIFIPFKLFIPVLLKIVASGLMIEY